MRMGGTTGWDLEVELEDGQRWHADSWYPGGGLIELDWIEV